VGGIITVLLAQKSFSQSIKLQVSDLENIQKILYQWSGIHLPIEHTYLVENRLMNRLSELNISSWHKYITYLRNNAVTEKEIFINLLTTNKTSFFREKEHFLWLENNLKMPPSDAIYVWSAASSKGHEAYSMYMFFSKLYKNSSVRVLGTDINTDVVNTANDAIYSKKEAENDVDFNFRATYMDKGLLKENLNTYRMKEFVRKNVKFKTFNLASGKRLPFLFDIIFLRNILIYFDKDMVEKIVHNTVKHLKDGGHLFLGLSEKVDPELFGLKHLGKSIYKKVEREHATSEIKSMDSSETTPLKKTKKVMIVKDSKTMQKKLSEMINQDQLPTFDYIKKPEGKIEENGKITKIIAIGSSTGGTNALAYILEQINFTTPPIVIVQHIPNDFVQAFSKRLNELTGLNVKVAEEGEILKNSTVYIAPGNQHLMVIEGHNIYKIKIVDGPELNGHRPSVDYLFTSLLNMKLNISAIILTGMGHDGAQEMLKLKENGAYTIAQDEESSVVFGMPREAIKAGAVKKICSLKHIADEIKKISMT